MVIRVEDPNDLPDAGKGCIDVLCLGDGAVDAKRLEPSVTLCDLEQLVLDRGAGTGCCIREDDMEVRVVLGEKSLHGLQHRLRFVGEVRGDHGRGGRQHSGLVRNARTPQRRQSLPSTSREP